jgi:hypothetical protein
MTSQDSHLLSASARRAALLVARIIFYNGLLIGVGLCSVAVGVGFFGVGHLTQPTERWLVVGVMLGLALMAFGFVAMATSRVTKLKNSR